MIDEKSIENIRKYGIAMGTGERKRQILVEEVGFPVGKAAENVIITGCFGVNPWGWTLQVRKVWQGQDTL